MSCIQDGPVFIGRETKLTISFYNTVNHVDAKAIEGLFPEADSESEYSSEEYSSTEY